jgi:hypothetical protein
MLMILNFFMLEDQLNYGESTSQIIRALRSEDKVIFDDMMPQCKLYASHTSTMILNQRYSSIEAPQSHRRVTVD